MSTAKITKFNNTMVKMIQEMAQSKLYTPEIIQGLKEWYTSFKTLESVDLKVNWVTKYINSIKPFGTFIMTKDSSIFAEDDPLYHDIPINFFGDSIDSRELFKINIENQNALWEYIQLLYVFGSMIAKTDNDIIEELLMTLSAQKNTAELTNGISVLNNLKTLSVFSEIYTIFKAKCSKNIGIDFDNITDYTQMISVFTEDNEKITMAVNTLLNTTVAIADKRKNDPEFIIAIIDDIKTVIEAIIDKSSEMTENIPRPILNQLMNTLKNSGVYSVLPDSMKDAPLNKILPGIKDYIDDYTKDIETIRALFDKNFNELKEYTEGLNENPQQISDYIIKLTDQLKSLINKLGIDSIEDIQKNPQELIGKLSDLLKKSGSY